VHATNARASCARPCGRFRQAAPRQTGTKITSKVNSRSLATMPERPKHDAEHPPSIATCRFATSTRLLDLRSLCFAAAAAAMPEGAARWIAPIPLPAQGCAVSGTQAEDANFSAQPKSAMPRRAFFW